MVKKSQVDLSNSSLGDMSPTERSYFVELLKEEIKRREENDRPTQIREIIPIQDWIMSEYYTGIPADQIYDYWKDLIVDIFRDDRKPEEKITSVILSGSIGIGKSCLSEDTKIPTTEGLLDLKTLYDLYQNGCRFSILSESGVRECSDVICNGESDTKILRMSSGRVIEGTDRHRIRVIRDGSIEWVRFDEIKPNDSVLMNRTESPFGSIHMNPDEAYTLGYMLGDGWCSKTSKEGVYSDFSVMFQYEQTDVAQRICRAWIKWFGKVSIQCKKKLTNGNTMITIRNYNKELATRLVESGFGSGASGKDIPSFIYRCDKETVALFIRGLMDSDGTVEKGGNINISLKTESCIRHLGELLSMFGINYRLYTKENPKYGTFYSLCLKNNESYLRYSKYIGFSIDYKAERLKKRVEASSMDRNKNDREIVPYCSEILRSIDTNIRKLPRSDGMRRFLGFTVQDNYTLKQLRALYTIDSDFIRNSEYLTYICEHDVYFDSVEAISSGRCNTYDLSVDVDHSYCFNGFISHNTCAELIAMRKLYEMSCWKNVNALYHLMSKTNIMFMCLSVNKLQALRTCYGDLMRLVDNCQYFNDNFARKKRLDSILSFPEGVTIAYGSNENHAIGLSVICTILDEANFIGQSNGPANPERALALYTSLVNRANSRFIIDGGVNHSLSLLVSSSTTESSVTERVIASSKDDPHTMICAPSQWEVKPDKFSKKFFFVCKGTNYLEPFIVTSTDDVNNFRISENLPKQKYIDGITDFDKISEEIEKLPPHMQTSFLRVPEDLRRGFETNMLRSLQDIGGVSIGSTGRLFNSVAVFNDCIDNRLFHPFVATEIVISTGDKIEIRDYLRNDFHLRHPERPRYLHIDQSYRTDSTGITSVYVDEILDEEGVKKPIFAVDFMLRINPPKPPRKIAIYKIRNFVTWLGTQFGMKIGKVTYDVFNSEESRQILEEMGFSVGYQSVDRTDKAYLDLVEIMYEKRLRIYDYPILRHELFNLIHYRDKRKVDHPKTVADASDPNKVGSKDVADSLAGALFNALQASISEESGQQSTIDDFLYANQQHTLWEPDMMSAEDMIDKQIEDIIDDFEMGGTNGGFGWM